MGHRIAYHRLRLITQENFDGEKAPIKIEESETDINHSVLVYGVKNSTIQIGGKINAVVMSIKCTIRRANLQAIVREPDSYSIPLSLGLSYPRQRKSNCKF